MSVDVDKYHKLICQTCDPVILLNVTNHTRRMVSFMLSSGKKSQHAANEN